DGGRQQAAGIVAQVDDHAAQARLFLQILQCAAELAAGVGLELGDADIAKAVFEHFAAHAFDLDDVADDGDFDGGVDTFTQHRQHDGRALGAAHQVDGIPQAHALDGVVVELDDQVAGLDARAV